MNWTSRHVLPIGVAGAYIGTCFLLAVLVLPLIGYLIFNQMPGNTHNPPIYPGAQQVHEETAPAGRTNITYGATARPEEIYSFYDRELARDNWVRSPNESQPAEGVAFEWPPGLRDGATDTVSTLVVLARPAQQGSDVELHLQQIAPPRLP